MKPVYKSGVTTGHGMTVIVAIVFLVSLGLVMVASSSMGIAEDRMGDPFYFIKRQTLLLIPGLVAAVIVYQIPLSFWQQMSGPLMILGFVLLILVLIPGIGKEVNGSRRWINLGILGFQPSELCKVFVMLYMAAYLVRRKEEVRNEWSGFMIPLGIMSLIVLLLLLEPDFGSVVVLMFAVIAVLFLAGVKLQQFIMLMTATVLVAGIVAVSSTYRVKRLVSFTNPWADPFGSGYQLTQSLIAFGRGEWFGVGLGESIQKLFYLPEAHTDFLYSILAEEFGLMGSLLVILTFSVLVYSGMEIGKQSEQRGKLYGAYLAYGLSILIGVQAFINMGVCSGLLPTKGLTLPFMSYGGTSLAISVVMIAFLLRVNFETNNNLQKIAQKKRLLKKTTVRKVVSNPRQELAA